MLRLIVRILGQSNVGKQWGRLAQVAGQIGIFVGLVNLLLLSVTAFDPKIYNWLAGYGIYLQFWQFVVILLLGFIFLGMLAWKFALPSFYSVWNDQFYRHDNLLRKDIELLKKDNKQIKKSNKEILRILKGCSKK